MSAVWEGEQRWLQKVRRIEALADFSDVFSSTIDEVVMPEVKRHFDSEDSGRWPALTPAYARRKRKLYGDRPILQATGGLYRSLTVPGAPGQIKEVGPSEAFFGTDLRHARFHHNARARRRRRRLFVVTSEFRRKVKEHVRRKMGERLRRV